MRPSPLCLCGIHKAQRGGQRRGGPLESHLERTILILSMQVDNVRVNGFAALIHSQHKSHDSIRKMEFFRPTAAVTVIAQMYRHAFVKGRQFPKPIRQALVIEPLHFCENRPVGPECDARAGLHAGDQDRVCRPIGLPRLKRCRQRRRSRLTSTIRSVDSALTTQSPTQPKPRATRYGASSIGRRQPGCVNAASKKGRPSCCIFVGRPRPSSPTRHPPHARSSISMRSQCPAAASFSALSTSS